MNKHAVAIGVAVFAATVVSLSASAGVQTVRYVKADNPGAAEPYDTEANAAGDIQTAIDFCGEDEKVIVLKGVYNTTEAVNVNKRLEVVGATGNPEDVIIHNTVSGYRCLKVTKAGAFVASMALENGSPDWDHDHTLAFKGTGAYVTAGTVSNLVVRSCTSKPDSLGMGAAITADGASTFITHCIITNNTASGGNRDGFYVSGIGLHLTGGAKAENCLVADNRTSFQSSWYGNGHCAVFVGNGSRMRFCTVVGNSCRLFGGIGVYGTGVFEECLVAGNTSTGLALNNKARHVLWSAFPEGVKLTETAISSDASQAAEAEYAANIAANQVCNATDVEAHGLGATTVLAATDRLVLDFAKKDWHLPAGSPAIGKVPVEAVSDVAALDVYGKPRVRDGKIDVGAAQFDASSAYVLECSATPDTRLYAPRTAVLTAKALGFGDAPVFYWDFNGDGKTDLVATEPSVTHSFGAGAHSISVCVSNDVATFGAKYAFAEPFAVLAQPVRYVKAGNPGAAEPYDTEANAAGDIQTAINFCGEEEKIVVLKGVYNTTEAVNVNKKLEVVGATGNPEDVIIHNTASDKRCLKVANAGAFVASMALENGSPDWDHDNVTSYKGTGAYVTAGTVSNLVVRSCTSKPDSLGMGAAITADGASTFITHCIITNNTASGGNRDGFYVSGIGLHLTGGAKAENCLVADNRTSFQSSWYGNGHCAVFVGNGSRMRFCTVVGNSCRLFGGIGVYGTGVFEECLVAGNTSTGLSTLKNRARHILWSAFPEGVKLTEAAISSDASQAAEAEYAANIAANQVCNATDVEVHGLGATTVLAATDRLVLDFAKKDWHLPAGSPAIGKVPVEAVSDMATLDVYGKPRVRDGKIDVGAAQFDASSGYVLECSVTSDINLYAPRTAVLTAKALGFGDAPVFYWDFNGDGKTDLVTTEPSVTQSFGAGVHSISVCVSNDVATFGAKYAFVEPFEVLAQPVRYVKADNPDAAEPYDTEANAAGDIQTAINFCGEEEKIVVLKGVYNTTEAVNVNKKLEVVGATGNPEDVIIHNTASDKRCLKVANAGAFVASMALENGKPNWDNVTKGNGTGALVTAGTVSNLVVRKCVENAAAGSGAAINAEGLRSFVTHCVITNNTSSSGTPWSISICGIGLDLRDGARAENCLVADNRTVQQSSAWYGWGQCAAFIGDKSRMRFCTVTGNRCALFGGVGVDGTGVFESCIVAGNETFGSSLDNKDRHAVWSAFPAATTFATEAGHAGKDIYEAGVQTAEAEAAEAVAANQVYNAVDNEAHGLGETTVLAATDRLVRNLAKKDWRLPKGSPAIDKVPVEAAADMATLDVYGNKRLFGGVYDIGCHERLVPGLMLLVR